MRRARLKYLQSRILRGTGALNKSGPVHTCRAEHLFRQHAINNGHLLALADVSGSIGSLASPTIIVGSGTTFDVSQVTGYSVNPLQTLAGFGTVIGAVTIAPTGIVNPWQQYRDRHTHL